nr:(-)-germacrene d synthase [Quercus suber]
MARTCLVLGGKVDIFNKFKDNMGNFKESLTNDVKEMLSFYEATHMRVHGEDILDEALKFTTTHLESMAINFSPPLATQLSHALNQPIRKCLPRVEARQYFSIYQENASHNEVLLNFVKLDFNMLQKQHQKELSHISRVVELYFWILGVYFEPQYSLARRILTKTICMASIIDDIYDVYGTHEELELFTNAIKRWDISCIDQLPKYMKLCYKVLLDVFEEIEEEMCKDGRLYCVYYTKVAMKKLVQAYFEEAIWLKEKYIPTMEEYMSNALISCGYLTLITVSFIGMGDIVTKEALEWVIKEPKIVRAASIINRLMNDIVSNETATASTPHSSRQFASAASTRCPPHAALSAHCDYGCATKMATTAGSPPSPPLQDNVTPSAASRKSRTVSAKP